jgi:carbamoyl-phosphate synthase large subunit
MKVLITGAGGDSGIATIRSLFRSASTFSVDSNKNASGFMLSDNSGVVPSARHPSFIDTIRDIVVEENIDFIFPNVDEELSVFASNKKIIPQSIISPLDTINICGNKKRTLDFLDGVVPIPKEESDYPKIIRPVVSRGSRDVFKVDNEYQLHLVSEMFLDRGMVEGDYIIQEYLPGMEVTVDAVCDKEGNLVVCCPRERISTKGGVCSVGRNFVSTPSDDLEYYVRNITKSLRFYGPINIQFKQDSSGLFKLLEINPRCSGGMTITRENGVNIADIALTIAQDRDVSDKALNLGSKTIFRYFKEAK